MIPQHDACLLPAKVVDRDRFYGPLIDSAEMWATRLYEEALRRAARRCSVPASRSVRYRHVREAIIAELAAQDRLYIETALHHVIEAIEAWVYEVEAPAYPFNPKLTALVHEGLAHAVKASL